jgi:CBS domain-containing protein
MKKTISVRYAMTRNPVIISPNENVVECAKKMIAEGVGSLIVSENDKLKGIITEKDLIEKVLSKNLDGKNIPASKVMTSITITIDPEQDIMHAINMMNEKKVRRLPVINKEGKLLGLITVHDILKIEPALFEIMLEKSKINPTELTSPDGECQVCGNYTALHKRKNKLVCNECD